MRRRRVRSTRPSADARAVRTPSGSRASYGSSTGSERGLTRAGAAAASALLVSSIATHGTRASAANTPHSPNDTRHPAVSAIGTATSGGTNVDTAMVVEYTVIMRPRRSGKYFFTSGGSSTLPDPTPAKTTAVAASSEVESTDRLRSSSPAAIRAIATTATRSSPKRRSNSGVSSPKTAKHTGGAAPIKPITTDETGKSAATWSITGDSDATADRSENATSTMPISASARPRQSGCALEVTRSATPPPTRGTRRRRFR
jgi:hypothetical protein